MEFIEISGERLKTEIYKKNLTLAEAGKQIGVSHGFFNSCIERGTMRQTYALLVENVIGIPVERFQRVEPELPKVKSEPATLDYERLYKVIYSATYEAMKKALEE